MSNDAVRTAAPVIQMAEHNNTKHQLLEQIHHMLYARAMGDGSIGCSLRVEARAKVSLCVAVTFDRNRSQRTPALWQYLMLRCLHA